MPGGRPFYDRTVYKLRYTVGSVTKTEYVSMPDVAYAKAQRLKAEGRLTYFASYNLGKVIDI